MATGIIPRFQSAARALLGYTPDAQKAIWGSDFNNFMGISPQGDSGALQDTRGDYTRAATLEPYVYKCLTVRTDALSQAKLRCYQIERNGSLGDFIDHEALALLEYSNPFPGSVRGTEELMGYSLGSLDLHGRSAWVMATNASGTRPTEVYWQTPTDYEPVRDPQTYFGGLRMLGTREIIPPERVVYLRTKNYADPLMGTSKIKVLREAINLRRASVRSNSSFFANSMRPDWILSGAWANTVDNVQRIRGELKRWLTGEHNRSPLILGDNAKATLLTMSPKDAEWINQQRISGEEIAAIFKVAAIYLNNFERATYENIQSAKTMLWHDGLIPDGNTMTSQLTREYLWKYWPKTVGKYVLAYDYSKVEGLTEDLARIYERVVGMMSKINEQIRDGVVTPNQARPMLEVLANQIGIDSSGYTGPVNGGDETLAPWTLIPRSQHSVQTVIDVQAARGTNPELVENVPGAPHAGDNAAEAAARIAAGRPPLQLPASTTPPPAPAKAKLKKLKRAQSKMAADIAQIAQIAQIAAQPTVVVVKARKHPGKVREERLAKPIELLTAKLKRHFQGLQTEALRSLRKSAAAAPENKAKLPDPTTPLYDSQKSSEGLLALISSGVSEAATAAYAAAKDEYGLDVAWTPNDTYLGDYMGMRTPLIRGIDLTTQQAITHALSAAADAGESMDQAATRVSGVFRQAIDNRSATIARTELMQAYGHASIAAYKDAGVEKAEFFDGDNDDEDEDGSSCADVNGMIVALDEAEDIMSAEHPNGTRAVAPVIGARGDMQTAAAAPPSVIKTFGPGVELIA